MTARLCRPIDDNLATGHRAVRVPQLQLLITNKARIGNRYQASERLKTCPLTAPATLVTLSVGVGTVTVNSFETGMTHRQSDF